MTTATDVMAIETEHLLQVYRRGKVVFTHGRGCRLFDADGRAYLDLTSGVGVAALGHAHPALAAAIASQASELLHTSNLYFHPLQGEVAARLASLSGLPRAFFCNSGAEAVEACLKFARRFWYSQGETERTGFVALEHSFHGRTMGSLSVTWDDHYRAPFQPLVPNVRFVPNDDPAALRSAVSSSTAAIILEPLQGEGGVRPLGPEFADAVSAVCRETGTLLIADEVQCGLGRTGVTFYSTTLGLKPDLMAVGKSLGADHGSTYGGNLLACRAALVFLDELQDLIGHVSRVGTYTGNKLRQLAGRWPQVREVRGAGVMWGLDLDRPALPVVEAALERGLLINRTSETVIRLLPPYVITTAEIDEALDLLEAAMLAAFGGTTT
jgi:acetylornithine/succinyldiaminopimelate/putrescine aminotransferase